MSYITKSILTKQIYLNFDPMHFNTCLISNQIPKYLSKHMENIFQVWNPKEVSKWKLANYNMKSKSKMNINEVNI